MNYFNEICTSLHKYIGIKLILASILSFIVYLVGANNWNGVEALAVLSMIDLVIALYVCVEKKKQITSRRLPQKLYKFSVYIMVIIAMNMLKIVSDRFAIFSDFTIVYFALTEVFSVLEHAAELGYKIPVGVLNNIGKELDR